MGLIAVYRSKSLEPDFVARLREGRTNIESNAYVCSLLLPDGAYHLEGLPPNEHTAIVAVFDGGATTKEAALASMRLAVQNITLEEGTEIQVDVGLESGRTRFCEVPVDTFWTQGQWAEFISRCSEMANKRGPGAGENARPQGGRGSFVSGDDTGNYPVKRHSRPCYAAFGLVPCAASGDVWL